MTREVAAVFIAVEKKNTISFSGVTHTCVLGVPLLCRDIFLRNCLSLPMAPSASQLIPHTWECSR